MESSNKRSSTRRRALRHRYAAPDLSGVQETPMHVLLTGSTGNLGSYLLDELLVKSRIRKLTCLNRSPDADERQKLNAVFRGLDINLVNSTTVEFLNCDLSKPHLGLLPATHRQLALSTTHVLHNAWPVDFNRHLTSFTPQIDGVRNLINFTLQCANEVTIFFVSSVSVVGRWGALAGASPKVPEEVLEDWRTAKMGYGQAKLVSERLLGEVTRTLGVKATICRVGQVAGPVLRGEKGVWNKQEWLPSLLASSKSEGIIPETLGPLNNVDWVPVDLVARIIVELLTGNHSMEGRDRKALSTKQTAPTVYHIVNPVVTTWSELLPTITEHLKSTSMAHVPFPQWVDTIKNSSRQATNRETSEKLMSDNPAIKLLSFFDELRDKAVRFPRARSAALDTKETTKASATLKHLDKVGPEWMELWMKQWAF